MGRWWAERLEARSFPSLPVQGRILFLHRIEQPAASSAVGSGGCALDSRREISIDPEIPEPRSPQWNIYIYARVKSWAQ